MKPPSANDADRETNALLDELRRLRASEGRLQNTIDDLTKQVVIASYNTSLGVGLRTSKLDGCPPAALAWLQRLLGGDEHPMVAAVKRHRAPKP